MSNVKRNSQTIIADLSEQEIELSEQELLVIAGGRTKGFICYLYDGDGNPIAIND